MSSRRVQVDIRDLLLTDSEVGELLEFLHDKKFLYRDYVGKDKGFAGSEYDYSFVKAHEKSRVEMRPMDEAIWLYLNTFGKEVK